MAEPIVSDPTVERFLPFIAEALGADFAAYRNHIYRVLSYAAHFLGDDPRGRKHIAFALVFHDVGMWTDHELAYLEPSEAAAERVRAQHAPHLDPTLVANIIHWHHKLLSFAGPDAEIVNAARKADWIDASMGMVRHGVPRKQVAAIEEAIPVLGFPEVLMRLAKDLRHGNRVAGLWRVLSRVYRI
ncbi:phosphohydrolase [Novosphingobium sp. ERN07]|uniref:phosphohydrolase n=1 Tax=unclassified Novosphingobium TaxID=2644732 RepID=UPI00061BAEF2|nr:MULTISPECIES: phosphohydrolase [unclassified Novosphingobium]NLR38674.1 phosphohydrolase [Novosphingobium sp. ERW19]NLR72647.1 phosphohydrolase [Novosphingobium sp. ERN07]GAO56783.1 metal-dependent phosphohydrolase, HD subdomain [Novosphingobium sp. MD-1]